MAHYVHRLQPKYDVMPLYKMQTCELVTYVILSTICDTPSHAVPYLDQPNVTVASEDLGVKTGSTR